MEGTHSRSTWLGKPMAIVSIGLLVALIGTATLLLFPQTRFTGLTPVTALQGIAIFGGMVGMMLGVHLMGAETTRERGERLRSAVRGTLTFGLALGALYALNVPFAAVVAGAATMPLAERLRRVIAWLGG